LTTPEKIPKRRRAKKAERIAGFESAVVVGVLLGGALGALQLQEAVPRWSQVPESLFVIAHVAAVLLVTAALTERMRTGLLCGVIAAISQFLALLGFYSYSYGIVLSTSVIPFQSLRILTYPPAGVIGGYIGHRIAEARSGRTSRPIRRIDR
jgi:ABC-type transport system involved in cytochrome c biogenesis permease subunit